MADDVTPNRIRGRRFDVTRRGYDRAEVEQYLGQIADEVDRLTRELQADEAAGLDVLSLLDKLGLDNNFYPDRITWTGCILF